MGFGAEVKALTDKYLRRMDYVARTSALEVANESRVPIGKGGRMPVDTNNLRNSMVAAIGSMPSGQTEGNQNKTGDAVAAQLVRWKPGTMLFYAGFPPKYARAMEYRYGYLRGATMRWGEIVDRVSAEAVRKIP